MRSKTSNLVCVYGVGKGDLYLELKGWLAQDPERHVIFLEDDSVACEDLMTEQQGREMLLDPQASFFSLAVSGEESVFAHIAREFLFSELDFKVHSSKDKTRAQNIFERLTRMRTEVHLIASDYRDLGTRVLGNASSNLARAAEASEGKELYAKFRGIPAIVCGAGPSLAKNIDMLKTLTDRALIFAAGSAISILSDHGLIPHFNASFDPDPPYRRFYSQTHFETAFFYQHRLSKDLLSLVHSPLLLMAANGSHPIEAWLEKKLGIASEAFDSGWTVANFCTAIASELGCGPIIFVGLDLCCLEENAVSTLDQRGEQVYTQKDWLMSKEWTESFAVLHPEITFLNATEGGLGFAGIPNISLADVGQKFLVKSWDMKGYTHAALQQLKKIQASSEDVNSIIEELQTSLSQCNSFCANMIEQHRKCYPNSPQDKGDYVLNEFELQEEMAFQQILKPLWDIWQPMILRKSPQHPELQKLLFFKRVIDG